MSLLACLSITSAGCEVAVCLVLGPGGRRIEEAHRPETVGVRVTYTDADEEAACAGAALLARAFERLVGDNASIACMTVEFVKPLVIGELTVAATLVRPGKKVRIVSGSLTGANGVEIVRATALAIRRASLDTATAPGVLDLPLPASSRAWQFPFFRQSTGYQTSMELRVARGTFGSGAMAAWMRMRVPLVPSETPSGLQRVVAAADSGNGLSVALDLDRYTFLKFGSPGRVAPASGRRMDRDERDHCRPSHRHRPRRVRALRRARPDRPRRTDADRRGALTNLTTASGGSPSGTAPRRARPC